MSKNLKYLEISDVKCNKPITKWIRDFQHIEVIFFIGYLTRKETEGINYMSAEKKIGRMRFMYLYTILGAGGFGLGIILIPDTMISFFRWPEQDPIVFGITGSVYAAFALLSLLGLISPLKFSPVLMLQLIYKSVWITGVIIPLIVAGKFPLYSILHLVIFLTYVVGDLVSIPFSYIFKKDRIA